MEEYTGVFKALSDATRLRIVWLLCRANTDLCVCEIMDSLDGSQYNVSRHLRIRKSEGLVQDRKEGKWVFYFLSQQPDRFQKQVLQAVRAIPEELLSLEYERLMKRISLREDGRCVVGCESDEWQKLAEQGATRG